MSTSHTEAFSFQFCGPLPTPQDWFCQQLAGVEISLMEARSQVVSVLDREISEVRSLKKRVATQSPSSGFYSSNKVDSKTPDMISREFTKPASLPANVLAISRELFNGSEPKPVEMALDPELERATIEELNAALAAAFSHISSH